MIETSRVLRRQITALGQRIAQLHATGALDHPVLAGTVASLQAEQAGARLLLADRQLQLLETVIDLARWRDGIARPAPQTIDLLPPVQRLRRSE